MKLKGHFLGPYKVVKVKKGDRYDVEKMGDHEGSNYTSVSADNMKLYSHLDAESSESEDEQDGRV